MKDNILIIFGIISLFLFGGVMLSSSNEMKIYKLKKESEIKKEVTKSGYTKSPFENTCDKCKLNIIPNEKAKSFRTVNTVNDDDFPLCFQNTKINKKCCTIKEEDTYFGCPKYCFDSIRENIKNIKPSTEDDYKYIMKENSYCNSF